MPTLGHGLWMVLRGRSRTTSSVSKPILKVTIPSRTPGEGTKIYPVRNQGTTGSSPGNESDGGRWKDFCITWMSF